jgi:septal ring factor EnvC (AmiA/AmiB activator)
MITGGVSGNDLEAEIARLQAVVVAADREIKQSHVDCDRYRAEIARLQSENERLRAALTPSAETKAD